MANQYFAEGTYYLNLKKDGVIIDSVYCREANSDNNYKASFLFTNGDGFEDGDYQVVINTDESTKGDNEVFDNRVYRIIIENNEIVKYTRENFEINELILEPLCVSDTTTQCATCYVDSQYAFTITTQTGKTWAYAILVFTEEDPSYYDVIQCNGITGIITITDNGVVYTLHGIKGSDYLLERTYDFHLG